MQVNTEPGQIMGTVGLYVAGAGAGQGGGPSFGYFLRLGRILYEMLSGQRAFRGETPAETMSAILKEEPAELSETARNVPPALERMVRHCLEKNPGQRFQSAGDLAFNLEVADGWSVRSGSGRRARRRRWRKAADRESAPSRKKKCRRASKLRELAGALVLSALMIGVGWWSGRGSGRAPLAEYQPITFRTGSIGNARFTPDGSIVYSASWDGGDNQLYVGRTDDPGARELGVKDAEAVIDLEEWRVGGPAQHGIPRRLCKRRYAGADSDERGIAARSAGQCAGCGLGGGRGTYGRGPVCAGKPVTGVWNIRSERCCWTALTGSAIPRYRRTGSGWPLPIIKTRMATTRDRWR